MLSQSIYRMRHWRSRDKKKSWGWKQLQSLTDWWWMSRWKFSGSFFLICAL